ncbi:MAG: hypothetical protein ACXWE5_14315, partial [Actinomycetota bacterium]
SPQDSRPGSPSSSAAASPSPEGAVLANGEPLPQGCPAGDHAGSQTVAFVAGGNAWALDPASEDLTCLFAAPDPGPFVWNPRGDRALLSGLAIESIQGRTLRTATTPTDPVSSWGHPIGKAIVSITANGRHLRKVYPGTQESDDVTPLDDVRYLNVIYHPSGLALAFVVDTDEGEEIWLSSNLGTDPVRLVFAVGGTRFGALAFTADGETLLYGAVHGDDAPLLHALDLTDPTTNQGLWHGEAGDRIRDISTQPTQDGHLIAMTVGADCQDSRAVLFERDQEPRLLARSPSRVVGWLGGDTVLVATGGCDGSSLDLASVDVAPDAAAIPLVTGVDVAGVRTPLPGFVPILPTTIEEEVGEGVG